MKLWNKKAQAPLDTAVADTLHDARQRHSMYITLDQRGLTEIPEELFSMTDVQFISLSGNKLKAVSERLWNLPKLQSVCLTKNPIETLPNRPGLIIDAPIYVSCRNQIDASNFELEIDTGSPLDDLDRCVAELMGDRELQKLFIYAPKSGLQESTPNASDSIHKLLRSIGNLESLESLWLVKFRLETVPDGVRQLRKLTVLSLNGLGLSELPDWIGELELDRFDASDNHLSNLPDSFRRLHELKTLYLSSNPLGKIPESVFDLVALESLSVVECGLCEIPADILRLTNLRLLESSGNPIESPPTEVVSKGLVAIRDYWRQRADAGVDYLCEAKLIILGEAGAGKTSLAHKIENPSYILQEDEKSTEGIDVIRYQFPSAIHTRDDGEEKILQRQFQVNIWDFGGQEIYHATHQFFLTRRSVYVLVCDDRKEDTYFSYWLQVVEMLSDASPLIIVQNEKQDRTRDINLSSLRARFANLRLAYPTNLVTNRGLPQVIKAIQTELENLPHVGVGLPATWKRVREALEKDKRDHISLEDYLAICEHHGFTRREDKLQLSGYLHDLGICLHFQDDPVLNHTVILKPSWGTDAVYRVLDDPEVVAARGHFTRIQLGRIWSEEKYSGMQHELLQLMMKFQLCYALETDNAYIAPQLLSSDQPAYPWDAAGGLVVRYEYVFLPKGILTRLIVAMHRLIAGGNLMWKTGVVLDRAGSLAEIIEEYFERRIRVRVTGPDRYGLFAIVDEQLARLHASFPRMQVNLLLPCPCGDCRLKAEPFGFALETLLKRAKKSQHIQCHDSGDMVDAARLVREILPSALLRDEYGAEPSPPRTTPELPEPPPTPEVFVSYAWNPESSAIVDKLQRELEKQGVRLMRDREEVRYRDSIRDFMRRIGQGKCVVVVISEKYLKSENCMFEMVEIAKAQGLRERIFPIVLTDANIYDATGRVEYVSYWESKTKKLDRALKTVRGENPRELQEDLNLYAELRPLFDGIAHTLPDMHALTPDQHEDADYEELIKRIQAQLGV